jgi:hypothetical protein
LLKTTVMGAFTATPDTPADGVVDVIVGIVVSLTCLLTQADRRITAHSDAAAICFLT